MADFNNFNNPVPVPNMPITFVDELSASEFYVGTSVNGKNVNAPTWCIKKIWKVGSVWNTGYPNGDQTSTFIWSGRTEYSYR